MGAFNDSMWQSHNQMQSDIDGKAGKGLAGTALGFGIGGTVLSLLGNNSNVLGNLLGGNRGGAELQYVSQLQSEIAQLKAEKASDEKIKDAYIQSLNDNTKLREEIFAYLKPLSEEAANNRVNLATLAAEQKCCCEKQELHSKILDQKIDAQNNLLAGKINETALVLNGKIDTMGAVNTGAFNSLNQTINCINSSIDDITNTLNKITDTIVPRCVVCPETMPRFNSFTVPTAQAPSCGSCASA